MRRSKYGNIKTFVDGICFDSKKEAAYYWDLKLRERAGEIHNLELQPKYELHTARRGTRTLVRIGVYKADFRFREGTQGLLRVVDVKGVKTAMYRWKKKHTEAEYGVVIQEV